MKVFNSTLGEEARNASIFGKGRELNGRDRPARMETRGDLLGDFFGVLIALQTGLAPLSPHL